MAAAIVTASPRVREDGSPSRPISPREAGALKNIDETKNTAAEAEPEDWSAFAGFGMTDCTLDDDEDEV